MRISDWCSDVCSSDLVQAIELSGHHPRPNLLAVGQIFLPRTNLADQETCRTIVESEIINFGYTIYGWREVPVDMSVIGDKAMMTRPEIEQIMIAGPLPDESSREGFARTRSEEQTSESQSLMGNS